VKAATTPLKSTPISTPTTPSSTPSKSGFSFAKGGGGDALISPASLGEATKSPQTPSTRFLSQNIWVVPLDGSLGEKLLDIVSCNATRMSLCVSTGVDSKHWLHSQQVIRRLIMANHANRLIHAGDSLGISFQGKGMDLCVRRVTSESFGQSVNELSQQMARINLDESTEAEPLVEALRRGLQNDNDSKRVRLYKLTSASNIGLVDESKDEVTDIKVDGSPDGKPHQVVAGLDSTLEQAKAILLPALLGSELFKNHSLRPPRGVLLHGPSGVGKSLLARQIKQDFESQKVNVKSVSCTSLQSRTAVVGDAERFLSRMFKSLQTQNGKPGTLLILDDIHLICPKRGGRNQQGADRLAATLLALLDGIGTSVDNQESGNLVILGITTDPSLLDPALRRPGRLDSEIEVPIPDEVSRAEILKFQLELLGTNVSTPELTQSDFMSISRLAKGFNGADVMLAIKKALRTAITDSPDHGTVSLTRACLEASVRSTKPSSISSITVEIPQVHWSSIGGMETVKEKLRESIELPITHAHLFEALNIPPPRGVLLYGPPGCSKTLMARALATEGQMNFLAVKGPELLSKWLGESERALASLFRRARMASPCIIFFDEVDAIASKRGGGEGGAGGERLLSQLLTELDGVGSANSSSVHGTTKKERVIVVGATNRPDLLDSALTRPGRIDRMIYVGLPDQSSRARIFEIGLKGKACSDDVEVRRSLYLVSFIYAPKMARLIG
jgi:SpoVK/Ycf46/Vps4 family AAA+-type ATPase